jgi:hypothetical protein
VSDPKFSLESGAETLDGEVATRDWKLPEVKPWEPIPADSWYARILRVTMAAFSVPLWPEL